MVLAVIRAKFADGDVGDLCSPPATGCVAEDSPYDVVWGCRDRRGYTGENLLGRALMRARYELPSLSILFEKQ